MTAPGFFCGRNVARAFHCECAWAVGPPRKMKALDLVTPAKAGVHVPEEVDSRLRGNDVTFDGVRRRNEDRMY